MKKRIGYLNIEENTQDYSRWDDIYWYNTPIKDKNKKAIKYAEKIEKNDLKKLGFSNILIKSKSYYLDVNKYYIMGEYNKKNIPIQKSQINYEVIFFGNDNKDIKDKDIQVVRHNRNPQLYDKDKMDEKAWFTTYNK